jgi:hypothetical protein
MNAVVLQGKNPSGQLGPLRLDELGRIELSETAAGDQSKPTQSVTGTIVGDTRVHQLLAQVLLSGADATLYTAAAAWRDVIVYAKNADTQARTCQLALGATSTDTTSLVKHLPLEVGGRTPVFVPSLAAGSVLRGLCDSANKVSVEIWGKPA